MIRYLTGRLRGLAMAGALLGAFAAPLAAAAPASAATFGAQLEYYQADGWGNTQYDVRFTGTVSSDSAFGYHIVGTLDAYCSHGAATRQSVRIDWSESGGHWSDRRYWCDETPQHIDVYGSRSYGNSVDITVGATSGVFNTYNYSNTYRFPIGTD